MLTLLGSLLGFLTSIFPDALRFFQEKREHHHHLLVLEMQYKMLRLSQHLEFQKTIRTAEAAEDIQESKRLAQSTITTNIRWLDALRGSVRPILTYIFFFLYVGVKWTHLSYLVPLSQEHNILLVLREIWHEEDQALFAAVMSFWFGHRAIRRLRQS